MARKNKVVGAIPGAGRPKKDYVKKQINISPAAANILDGLKWGETPDFVSKAILAYQKDK